MSDIKFDNSKRYIRKNSGQKFGKGVWYRDVNNDGKYNSGEQVINIGNRIKNSNDSYVQLNSDGTQTTLFKNGKVTKGVNVTNLDKQAMSKGLIYGRQAISTGNQFKRAKTGKSSWDIDTDRISKAKGDYFFDRYGNYLYTNTNRRYIGNVNNSDVLGIDDNSFSNNDGATFNSLNNSNNTKLITRRYSTQALGQYVNPDTKQKTNFVKVNFGDNNGQNQYLKGNYWVYDDGDGNVQTIGFRGKDGKDYAFVTPTDGGQAFLNSNAKGTILGQTSIGASRLKSYGAGFTPGMDKWRGKGGWYTNVGTELPSLVYGARDGYLYDKNNRQIGFNANGQYYLKSNTNYEKPSNLHSNFKEGWKGTWGDLNNLASRFDITNNQDFPHRFSGVFGDLGRGVQHIAQGTIGAATQYILPDSWNKVIGKYGQIADLGKDLRTITSGISALTSDGEWVAPWDTKNKGLVDYADIIGDAQGLQDFNDAINGATILFGTRGVGGLKGAVKGSVVADAANIAGKAVKGGYKGAAEAFSNGTIYAGRQVKAGLRPSNIAPIIEQTKEGFKNGAAQGWQTFKANHQGVANFSKNVANAKKIFNEGYQHGRAGMTPSNVVAMYNEFRKPTQKVTNASTKKQYISPNTSIKNKPIQTELQFGEPIPTKVTSNKRPYISPSISTKATANKIPTQAEIQFGEPIPTKVTSNKIPVQTELQFGEQPIATSTSTKVISNKRPYISPNTSTRATSNKIPTQAEIQFGKNPQVEPVTTKRYIQEADGHSIKYQQPVPEVANTAGVDVFNQTRQQLLNNRQPYVSPNVKVLSQNEAARIVYNMKFNPKEYASGVVNQPKFNIPERPIASNYTPKLNYNAESNIGKVPQAKVIQQVQPKQPSVKTISWEEAVKQQKKAVKQKKTAQTATKPLTKKSKPSNNKVRTPKPKVAKHYLGGVLTNNKFEKWISL